MTSTQTGAAANPKLWNPSPGVTLDLERHGITASQDGARSGVAGVKGAGTSLLESSLSAASLNQDYAHRPSATIQKQRKPIPFFHPKNETAAYQH